MVNGNVEVLESPLSQKELEFMVQDIARDTERNFKRLEGTDRVPLPPSLVYNYNLEKNMFAVVIYNLSLSCLG